MTKDTGAELRMLWEPHCCMCGQLLGKMGDGSFVVITCPKCKAVNTIEVSDVSLMVNALNKKLPAL